MSFFREVVLPSVELPNKPTYSIPEALLLLGCSRSTFYRKIAKGHLTLSPDKRIYRQEFENYFGKNTSNKDYSETKK